MFKKTGAFLRRNAIALAALFVALGGTSYAAFGVPINSVGSAQLRNGAIHSGNAQTMGMRPEAGINTGSATAQNVILRAVNSCTGTMTVSALNLTVTGFK